MSIERSKGVIEVIRLVISLISLILAFISIFFIIIMIIFGSKLALFGLASAMFFSFIGMLSGGFVSSRFGSSLDYEDNKRLVTFFWIMYAIITLMFIGVAVYEIMIID